MMSPVDQKPEPTPPSLEPKIPRIRLLRYLPLLIIGVAAVLLLLNLAKFENIVSIFLGMSVWLVVLAVLAQTCSYLGSGFLLKVIMSQGQVRLSLLRGTLITMSAESLELAGGLASHITTVYYWVAKSDSASGNALMAGILPTLFNMVVLIFITIFGMLYLMLNHALAKSQIIFYVIILAAMVVIVILVFLGLKHRDKMKRLLLATVRLLNRILKHKYDLIDVGYEIDLFYDQVNLLRSRGLVKLSLGPIMNALFDMLTLYLFFIAAGYYIKPSILIAGYSLSFLFSRVAFFVPGGAGVVEGGMVAIYVSLGVPLQMSVVAVLCYRFVSFWLPSLFGFGAMIYLRRTTGPNKTVHRKEKRPGR